MSYDAGCKVFWCDVDGCGGEMTLDCERSMGEMVVLACQRCGFQRRFFDGSSRTTSCGSLVVLVEDGTHA